MTAKEALTAYGIKFLRDLGYDVPDDAEIVYEERAYDPGGCPTCGSWMEYEVDIIAPGDQFVSATYSGKMTDLIEEILNWEEEQNDA